MEISLRVTRVPLLAALCLSVAGTAQAPPGSAQVGVELGRQFGGSFAAGTNELFTSAVRMENAPLKGFWFGTQFTPAWGLEVSTRRSSTRFILPAPATLTSMQQGAWFEYAVMELAAVRTWRFGSIHPYAFLGAGLANLNINVTDKAYRDTNRTSLGLGLGTRWWLTDRFAFRLDARAHAAYLQERQGGLDQGALDRGRWLRTEEIMAGLLFSSPGH